MALMEIDWSLTKLGRFLELSSTTDNGSLSLGDNHFHIFGFVFWEHFIDQK